jgi:toluene monooxygenase system ferredoxin subunit
MTRIRAASLADFDGSGLLQREVGGRKILLVVCDGGVSAFEDRCCHLGLPLGGGRLEGSTLICPAHEWEYDVRTGRGVNPASACLKMFPVTVDRDEILVDVP